MKVLLKEDIDTLGYAGEVHEVAPGYGRNYLIPQGLAVQATPGVLKAAESWRKKAQARREQIRREHEALVARIDNTVLTFTARAGEQGKLYGSITTANIADALNEELGIDLDRRKVESEPLRQIGEHQVAVVLSRDYRAHVTVNIHPEGGEIEPAEEAALAAAAAEAAQAEFPATEEPLAEEELEFEDEAAELEAESA